MALQNRMMDPTNLANAFTRRGLVKSFWNIHGSEGQPYGPAPGAETDVIPDGTLQPTTASWQAIPAEQQRRFAHLTGSRKSRSLDSRGV
jgi:hypothetical protein